MKHFDQMAVGLAKKYLSIAGTPLNETVLRASGSSGGYPGAWYVDFDRAYKRYRFDRDGAYVNLDSSDGSLISLHCRISSPDPKSVRVSVDQKRAEAIGEKYLRKKTHIDHITSSQLGIVFPDNYYEDFHGKRYVRSNNPRLAWIVRTVRDKDGHVADVWVDARNGRILGGVQCL